MHFNDPLTGNMEMICSGVTVYLTGDSLPFQPFTFPFATAALGLSQPRRGCFLPDTRNFMGLRSLVVQLAHTDTCAVYSYADGFSFHNSMVVGPL